MSEALARPAAIRAIEGRQKTLQIVSITKGLRSMGQERSDSEPVEWPSVTHPMIKQYIKLFLITISLALSTSCVSWQRNDAGASTRMTPWNVPNGAQPARLVLDTTCQLVTPLEKSLDLRQTIVDVANARLEDHFANVGGIAVQRDRESADYRLVVRVRHEPGDPAIAVLAAYTLFLVPIWTTNDYVTDFELVDKAGKFLGKRRIQHSQVTAFHLIFFPVCFFWSPASANRTMWDVVLGAGAEWASQLVAQNVRGK